MLVRYRVNQTDYTHPLLAWEAAKQQNTIPELSLGDNFKGYDWHAPVTHSIRELEDIRVQQIITKNRPIRLVYSGGSDSHTIAHAFARARHPIRYTLIDYTNMREDLLDGISHMDNKVKRLQALHAHYGCEAPEYEIIRLGVKELESHFQKDFFLEGAFYGCNQSFSLNQIEANLKFSKWAPDTTTNVYGIEKPRIYQDHIGLYWQITDTMSMYAYSHEYDSTWFYIDEALPELIKAQCMQVVGAASRLGVKDTLIGNLHELQTNDIFYYRWCIALGRQIDTYWAMKSRECKTYQSTFELPTDTRYIHLNRYQFDVTKIWQNYEALFHTLKDITGSPKITPILSPRFHFSFN